MAKILVIDDDPAILATVDLVLQRAGHQVVTSLSGYEGLERLERELGHANPLGQGVAPNGVTVSPVTEPERVC